MHLLLSFGQNVILDFKTELESTKRFQQYESEFFETIVNNVEELI